MLTSISAAAPRLTPCTPSAPRPVEPEAAQPLDLTSIDTPQKALALPCLNPALLGVALTGAIASSMTGSPATAVVSLTLGDLQGKLTYTFNGQNPQQALQVTGEIGGQAYQETWSIDQQSQKASVHGSLGENAIDLTLSAGQKGMLLRGTLGQVGVTQILGGESDLSSITGTGKLGSESLEHSIKLTQDDNNNYQMAVTGKLGQSTLEQSATIARDQDGQIQFNGQGKLAELDFTMAGTLYTGGK